MKGLGTGDWGLETGDLALNQRIVKFFIAFSNP